MESNKINNTTSDWQVLFITAMVIWQVLFITAMVIRQVLFITAMVIWQVVYYCYGNVSHAKLIGATMSMTLCLLNSLNKGRHSNVLKSSIVLKCAVKSHSFFNVLSNWL